MIHAILFFRLSLLSVIFIGLIFHMTFNSHVLAQSEQCGQGTMMPACTVVPILGMLLDDGDDSIESTQMKTITDFGNTYVGKFRSGTAAYSRGAIALREGMTDTMIVAASETVFGVGERSIPLTKLSGDKASLNGAAVLQDDISIKDRIPVGYFDAPATNYTILSLWVHNNWLWVFYAEYYDASGTREDNVAVLTNLDDLANSPIYGGFRAGILNNGVVADAQYVTKGVAPIPISQRSKLDEHSHSLFASLELAILSRVPVGHSFYTYSAATWVSVVQNAINVSANPNSSQAQIQVANNANLPVTQRLAHTNQNRITNDLLNYGGASGGVNNDMYTEKSNAGAGFIYPGTSQVFYLGSSGGHTPDTTNPVKGYYDGGDTFGTIAYKGNYQVNQDGSVTVLGGNATLQNNVGQVFDGYAVYISQDVDEFYWLYNLDDILVAPTKHSIRPYEYGSYIGPVPRESIPLDGNPNSLTPETANGITRATWSADGQTAYFLRSYTTENGGFPAGDSVISKHVFTE